MNPAGQALWRSTNLLVGLAAFATACTLDGLGGEGPAPVRDAGRSGDAALRDGGADLAAGRGDAAAAGGDLATLDLGLAAADLAGDCVGVRPPQGAWGARPGPRGFDPDGGALTDGGAGPDPTAVGSPAPTWALADFQPRSCGRGAVYGLDVFRGRPLLVALLAGW